MSYTTEGTIETIKKMKSLKEKLSKELEAFKAVYLKNVEAYLKAEFVRIEAITENEIISSRGWTNRSGRKEHTKASFAYWSRNISPSPSVNHSKKLQRFGAAAQHCQG
jgi:hypothetical protein